MYMRDCKERHCFVRAAAGGAEAEERVYERVDVADTTFTLAEERWRCTEALFDPSLVGVEGQGLDELVQTSISNCPLDVQSQLWKNIVLGGGSTMFPSFKEELQTRLAKLREEAHVVAAPERKHSVWLGGSILGGLSFCPWITRADYEAEGPETVHKRSSWSTSTVPGDITPAPRSLPALVVTLHLSKTVPDEVAITGISAAGEELTSVQMAPSSTIGELRAVLAKTLSTFRLRLVLPSGRLLATSEDETSLSELL